MCTYYYVYMYIIIIIMIVFCCVLYMYYRLDVVPKPWNKSVVQAYESVSVKLFVTNPVLTQVLNDWYRDLR